MKFLDRLLITYFQGVLEIISIAPPPITYYALRTTGSWFRNFSQYASSYEPGVLKRAAHNIEKSTIQTKSSIHLIKDYLRFETRFVLENIWIRKSRDRYIKKGFNKSDIQALRQLLGRPHVIVTAHNSGICMLVKLLEILGHQSHFICMNVLNCPRERATPMQRAFQKMWLSWCRTQPMIYVEDGNVLSKSREALSSGHSVILAMDVPGYRDGVKADLLGLSVMFPTGAARIANECGVPMLVAIPWATGCRSRYRIFLKTFRPTGEIRVDTTKMVGYLQDVLSLNPACWNGWLYIDKMLDE